MDANVMIAGSLSVIHKQNNDNTISAIFNQFRFAVAVSARERPRVVQQFRVAVNTLEGTVKASVYKL
jgi:hypothetical protein